MRQGRLKAIQDEDKAELATLQQTMASSNAQYSNELAQRDTKINTLNDNAVKSALELANAKNDKNVLQTQVANLTNAVRASQEENAKLQADLSAAQQANSGNVVKLRDLNVAVTKLTAENDTLVKQRKYLEEQVSQLKNQVGQVDAGSGVANHDGQNAAGTPGQIIGRISDVQVVAGVRNATISIGSSDSVTKGMKFYVVDTQGAFVGTLVIMNVQSTESIGTLDGPPGKVEQIKTGMIVKTQL
jgi:hypothetical protein